MNIIHLESNDEDITKIIIKGEKVELLSLFTFLSGELIKRNITTADKLKEYIDYSQLNEEELFEKCKEKIDLFLESLKEGI